EIRPDILCLSEITEKWLKDFDQALPDYKYKFDEGVPGGAALYSSLPIEKTFPREGPKFRRYGTRGVLSLEGKKILIVSEHTPAPFTEKRWKARNEEFARLAGEAKEEKEIMVIAGDFNSSPWSWYFQKLIEDGNLKDSENGHGLQPSWNALSRIPPMVPIDHCLTTGGIEVVTR